MLGEIGGAGERAALEASDSLETRQVRGLRGARGVCGVVVRASLGGLSGFRDKQEFAVIKCKPRLRV